MTTMTTLTHLKGVTRLVGLEASVEMKAEKGWAFSRALVAQKRSA